MFGYVCNGIFYLFKSQVDEFVIAHALGWFGKALVLRDYWFLWILSVLFELAEYTYQHQLPNFAGKSYLYKNKS